jgi:hypothetical protein
MRGDSRRVIASAHFLHAAAVLHRYGSTKGTHDMTTSTDIALPQSYYRPSGGGLADVVDLILEKGLVIDLFARVSLVGIELLTIDVRVVVASVDTYLRFAQACNRLDIARSDGDEGIPQVVKQISEGRMIARAGETVHNDEDRIAKVVEDTFHDLWNRHFGHAASASDSPNNQTSQ